MKKSTILSTTVITGIALAVSAASPVYAWHPEGKIVKQVTNMTTGSAMSDANTVSTAVAAKPGDTLKYTITITNTAKAAEKQYNDLAFVVLKDTLPVGVELVNDPTNRQLSEELGTILPGKSVTKTLTVKVTATKDGVIENKACFTGDSVVKDAPRNGCDTAIVKVSVPQTPVTPPVTPPVVTTPAPQPVLAAATVAPAELPKTGPASLLALGGFATITGYLGNLLRLRATRTRA